MSETTLLPLLATAAYSAVVLSIIAAAIIATLQGTKTPFSVGYAIAGSAILVVTLASPVEWSFFAPLEVSTVVADRLVPVVDGGPAEERDKNAAIYFLVLSGHLWLLAIAGGAFAAVGRRRTWF